MSRTVIFTEHTYVTVVDFKGYILSPNIPWGELDRCTPPLIFYHLPQHFHRSNTYASSVGLLTRKEGPEVWCGSMIITPVWISLGVDH